MSVFADHLDLRTAVMELVPNPAIIDMMPRLIRLAEADFNRRLRLPRMMAEATVTVTGGTGALPADYLEAAGLFDAGGAALTAQPASVLRRADAQGYFAVSGSNIIVRTDGAYTLAYYAAVPSIAGSLTATSWLLAEAPGLYLYAVAAEAAKAIRDVEAAAALTAVAETEAGKAQAAGDAARWRDVAVRVRGVVP